MNGGGTGSKLIGFLCLRGRNRTKEPTDFPVSFMPRNYIYNICREEYVPNFGK